MKKITLILLFILLTSCSNKKLTCPENYELKGKECITIVEEQLIKEKICNNGYQLINDKCQKEIVVEPKKENKCENGYLISNGGCMKFIIEEAPITSYNCKEGYKLEGTTCNKYETYKPLIIPYQTGYNLSCNKGGNLVDGVNCVMLISSIPASTVYGNCKDGYDKAGMVCTKYDKKSFIEILSCDSGYTLKDNLCKKEEYIEPSEILTCKDDFKKTGEICKKEIKIKPTNKD